MPKIRFHSETAKNIEPTDKSVEYYATNFNPGDPGRLILRVSPMGKKTWAVVYRLPGTRKPQKVNIGGYPAMEFTKAKKKAADLLSDIADGVDPKQVKQARLDSPDFDYLCKQYLKHHANKKKDGGHADKLKLNNSRLDPLRRGKAEDIKRRHVIKVLDNIKEDAPVVANRYKALLSKLFNFAIRRDLMPEGFANPAVNIDMPHAETSRSRVYNNTELQSLWKNFDNLRGDLPLAMRLLTLTGQRLSEILGLRWEELDFEAGIITLPESRTKNKKAHSFPMSLEVRELLADIDSAGEFVFPAPSKTGHVMMWSRDRESLKNNSGVLDFRPHDLRRTMTTRMGKAGVNRFIQDRITNHVDGSIGAVYDRHDYMSQMQLALDKWADTLTMIVNQKQAKVVELRRVPG